jgi:hypothetical protein
VQRSIEILIGRLITDPEFRHVFLRDPSATLELAGEWGLEFSRAEIRAVLATDRTLWDRVAAEIDSRFQKAGRRKPSDERRGRS